MNKKAAIILAIIIVVVVGPMVFVVLTVVNSKGCSQIVIDTNELHSGIDIPAVDFVNCYFDEERQIRVSIYKLKMNAFHLSGYTSKFELVDQTASSGITQLDIIEQPKTNILYERSGTKWGDKWKYVVEPQTGMLWVEIIYG